MKERPILFSAAMVRPVLDGRKTKTRRTIRISDKPITSKAFDACDRQNGIPTGATNVRMCGFYLKCDAPAGSATVSSRVECPYGQVGDHLWVREEHYRFGHWEVIPGVKTKGGRVKNQFVADSETVLFEAPQKFRKGRHHKDPLTPAWHKRLARFMPKKFSRITLEITDVRVERLLEISVADCIAEGIDRVGKMVADRGAYQHGEIVDFSILWESINGKGSWALNPLVWVISFRVIK